jgi:hypothetical protein
MKPALLTLLLAAAFAHAATVPVTFTVDASRNRTAISPFIYGNNFDASTNWSGAALGLSLGRLGGNRWTAYNWENNASNAGTDWQNENDDYLGGGNTAGEAVRARVAAMHAANAAALVTVPLVDYVAADKNGGGDVNQTVNYLATRFKRNVARKGAAFSYPPATGDGTVYQDEFVSWLESTFPYAATDAKRRIFYSLDNEPDLWSSTHPRIHPAATTYAEMMSRTEATASAIKAVAPKALVFGPVSYGYNGFVSLQDAADANGRDFIATYLSTMKGLETKYKQRLVDVLDLHWYPEAQDAQGRRITDDAADASMAAARVQAPRSLWDAKYVEKSWIAQDYLGNQPINLLGAMKAKIDANYPGTKLAITEYYYGGGADISGAIAEADVLGIFGREGVFAANLWHLGSTDDRYIQAAMRAFTNYDGKGAKFGDTSVYAATSDDARSALYASAQTGSSDLTLVAINRSADAVQGTVNLAGGSWATADVWELGSSAATFAPKTTGLAVSGAALNYTLSPMTVSVFKLHAPSTGGGGTGTGGSTPSALNDCLFNWGEANYPMLFAPHADSLSFGPYYLRYYTQTKAYLAVSNNDLLYLGPLAGIEPLNLGAVSTWYSSAKCK